MPETPTDKMYYGIIFPDANQAYFDCWELLQTFAGRFAPIRSFVPGNPDETREIVLAAVVDTNPADPVEAATMSFVKNIVDDLVDTTPDCKRYYQGPVQDDEGVAG